MYTMSTQKNREQQLEIERLKAQLAELNGSQTTSPRGKVIESKGDGVGLKSWMEQMGVFDDTLYSALKSKNIKSHHLLRAFPQNEFDSILRNVRTDKFTNLKDQTKRDNIDEELVRFEKVCRSTPEQSGNIK